MKKIVRKNQIMITVLACMIAVAGYLNYSGRLFGKDSELTKTSGDLANQELLDLSQEELDTLDGEVESLDGEVADGTVEGVPGEAVFTSAMIAEAKITREQVRAQNKETLQEIIDSDSISQEQKNEAVMQMIKVTEMAEKEMAAENLLASKGFVDNVVSLTENTADVMIHSEQLSEADRAQIEDIITRKTGVSPENIVITPIYENEE